MAMRNGGRLRFILGRRPRPLTSARPWSVGADYTGRSARTSERMFEAEVDEDAVLPAARSDPDGESQAGDDLQAVLEIMGPADARAHEEDILALGLAFSGHRLGSRPGGLDQQVDLR